MLLIQQVTSRSSTLQGKSTKLIDAKALLLQCGLFTNVLAEAKHFSLPIQTQNINIISILDSIKSTKCNYKQLLKKLKKNPS